MKNFKQVKDGIKTFFEGNDMVESVFMAKTVEDMFSHDVDMRYVGFAPSEFEIGKTDWALKFAFVFSTKVPLGDEDAWITAQEEHVLLSIQLNDMLDQNEIDSEISEAIFALPEDLSDSSVVTATFTLSVLFQRVQYVNFDE